MAIKKGDLVKIANVYNKTALVLTETYCTVFTTQDLNRLIDIDSKMLNRTLLSSEVLVVDVLFENSIYKKVPIATLKRVR